MLKSSTLEKQKNGSCMGFNPYSYGSKGHMALMLIPIGFLFKYIYDKKGLNHSYAMHFATNILVVIALFLSSYPLILVLE